MAVSTVLQSHCHRNKHYEKLSVTSETCRTLPYGSNTSERKAAYGERGRARQDDERQTVAEDLALGMSAWAYFSARVFR
jgi:hypothetical protein